MPLLPPVGYTAHIAGVGKYLSQSAAIVGANQKVIASIGTGLTRIGGGLTKFVTLPLLAVGAVSVLAFSNFNKAMTESTAIMGDLSGPVKEAMIQAAREVAKETTFSHKEAAEAYFFLASAGLTAEESIGSLGFVSKFAQAGAFDLALATDLLTDAQSAMALKGDTAAESLENMTRVGDVFVKANTKANATVQQFSESITEQAGTALQVANKSLEEGVALLSLWADAGLKGSQAGTTLASMLTLLPKVATKNADAFADYGIEIFDSTGKLKNFADIADEFTPLLQQLSDEERAVAFNALGINKRLVTSIGLFKEAGPALREFEAAYGEAGGTVEEVSEKQLQSMSAQFSLLKSKAEDVAITLGAALAPAVLAIAKGLDKFIAGLDAVVQEFLAWPKPMQKIVGVTLIFIVLLGPLLLLLGLAIGVFTQLIVLAPAVAGAWALMTGPMLPFIIIGVAIVLATLAIIKHWDALSAKAEDVGDSISNAAKSIIRNWRLIVPALLPALGPIGIIAAAAFVIATNWDKVTSAFSTAKDAVVGFGSAAFAFVKNNTKGFLKLVPVLGMIVTATLLVIRNWRTMIDAGRSLGREMGRIGGLVGDGFNTAAEAGIAFATKIIDILLFLPRKAFEFGALIPDRLRFGLITGANKFLQTLANFISKAISIINPFGWAFSPENMPEIFAKIGDEAGLALVNSMLDSLGDFATVLDSAIAEPIRNVRSFIADLQSELSRLLNLPSIQSAGEDVQLTNLRADAFALEPGVELDAEAREEAIDELLDKQEGLQDQLAELDAAGGLPTAARVEARQALEDEISAIDDQIEKIEDTKTAREKEMEVIQEQISALERLQEGRRLERDILLARGVAADQTLIADNAIIAAAERMILRIGEGTAQFAAQAEFINTVYIPSILSARDALQEANDGMGDMATDGVPDLTDGLGVLGDELGETGEDFSDELEIPGSAAIGKLWDGFVEFLTDLGGFEAKVGNILQDVVIAVGKFVGDIGVKMFEAGKAIVREIWSGIKAVATDPVGVANKIANVIIGVINSITEKINRALEFKIEGPFGLGSFTLDPPDIPLIPLLAAGGPLAAGQLAVVGEQGPELFVPQSAGQVVPMGGMASLMTALSGVGGGGESNSFRNYGTLTLAAEGSKGTAMIRTLIRSL